MNLIEWMNEGDVAIKYWVSRDLLSDLKLAKQFREKIATEGWGQAYLALRDPETMKWGNGIYSPKWISTHYTLLELKNLGLIPNREFEQSAQLLLDCMWQNQGLVRKGRYQDMCVGAMILNICAYGKLISEKLSEIVDYILKNQKEDGGWNCDRTSLKGSLHTTLSVLEAFLEFERSGYTYRLEDIHRAIPEGEEFILRKQLFRSVHSGEIIYPGFLICPYPSRWQYDILRALEYFAKSGHAFDPRMEEALNTLIERMDENGRMPVEKAHPNLVFFKLESGRSKSRINTYRMLVVLKAFRPSTFSELIKRT